MDQILNFIIVIFIYLVIFNLGIMIPAKVFGVPVERFSIGMPPRMLGRKIGETDYCLSWVPLGGYVKMAGMVDESLDNTITSEPWEFVSKPYWQRLTIILAFAGRPMPIRTKLVMQKFGMALMLLFMLYIVLMDLKKC